MVSTQIETREFGVPNMESGLIRTPSASRKPKLGFTLTELLVVITIIGILSALLLGAVQNALLRAKQAEVTLELQQMGAAIEDLKNEFGAYPPNAMNNNVNTLGQTDYVRMFKKAFPRSKEPPTLIQALAARADATGGGPFDIELPVGSGGLNGAEAVYFWLGGFSDDVAYPISGPGGPSFQVDTNVSGNGEILEDRNRRYEFDLARLGPRTAAGVFDDSAGQGRFLTYEDPRPGANRALRRINFWVYTVGASTVPVHYFDTSRHSPEEYDLDMTGVKQEKIYALKQLREGVSAAQSNADITWVENDKFQLLHPGIDDIWGDAFLSFKLVPNDPAAYRNVLLAPEGPFIGDVADTLGNFMSGTLEDKQE